MDGKVNSVSWALYFVGLTLHPPPEAVGGAIWSCTRTSTARTLALVSGAASANFPWIRSYCFEALSVFLASLHKCLFHRGDLAVDGEVVGQALDDD
jgi:hypothetical protein